MRKYPIPYIKNYSKKQWTLKIIGLLLIVIGWIIILTN